VASRTGRHAMAAKKNAETASMVARSTALSEREC